MTTRCIRLALSLSAGLTGAISADTVFPQDGEPTDRVPRHVVTLHNYTSNHLNYHIRVRSNLSGNLEWGEWKSYWHKYPNRGYQWHSFYEDVEGIQIRFDRIGGDGKYTEQVYDLGFNRVVKSSRDLGHHDGKPYRFQFDRGGRHLDLVRHGW